MSLMEADIPKKNLSTEERLRAEVESLQRQLEEQKRLVAQAAPQTHQAEPPSRMTLGALSLVGVLAVLTAFFAGYLPHQKREALLTAEAKSANEALPAVTVVSVVQSSNRVSLVLPGSIQALTEAPVLARASGYIRKRYVDIGDRVKEGQLLAEIDAVEFDQSIAQGKASVEQAKSALEQANANLQQGKTNAEMARYTYERWNSLVQKGAVSRQDADTYKSTYEASTQNVDSLEKAVNAARSNIAMTEANL